MESIMLPQNHNQDEDTRRIDGHPPPIVVEVWERSHRHWLVLAIVLVAVAALLVWGIWFRVSASTTFRAGTAQSALPPVSVVSPKRPSPPHDVILPQILKPS